MNPIRKFFDVFFDCYGPQHWWHCQSGARWEIIVGAILLYAFDKPIFVIDAYIRRIAERHLHLDGTLHYDILQKIFMDALPSDVAIYNEYHALIVALCKDSCHKSACGEICKKIANFL